MLSMVANPFSTSHLIFSVSAVDREISVIVDRDRLTVDNLVSALKELLNNPKYYQNAQKISKMMNEKPEQSEKQFIEWIEFTANNPGLHNVFNLPGAEMTAFWYYCLDVAVVSAVFMIFVLCITWKVLTYSMRWFSVRAKTKFEWSVNSSLYFKLHSGTLWYYVHPLLFISIKPLSLLYNPPKLTPTKHRGLLSVNCQKLWILSRLLLSSSCRARSLQMMRWLELILMGT